MDDENKGNQKEPEKVETSAAGQDLEVLNQALAKEKEKAENYLANWQRAQADFTNYKRRSQEEKEEVSRSANAALLLKLLPVLDDLERALVAIPPELAEQGWVKGVGMVARSLRTTLEAQGLTPILALGQPFDPFLHEAIRQDSGKEGMVIEEVQRGYKFRDRVLRPSKVVVGNGTAKEARD